MTNHNHKVGKKSPKSVAMLVAGLCLAPALSLVSSTSALAQNASNDRKDSSVRDVSDVQTDNFENNMEKKLHDSDFEGVVSASTEEIKANPTNAKAYYFRAIANFQLKKSKDEVLVDLNKAIELDSSYVNALRMRAYVLAQAQQYDAAIADLNQVLKLDSKNDGAAIQRLKIHATMESAQGMVEDLTILITNHPDEPTLVYYRGMCYKQLGQKALAKADFQKAVTLYIAANDKEGADKAQTQLASVQDSGPTSQS